MEISKRSRSTRASEKAQLFHFKCQEARGTGCLSLNGLRVKVSRLADILSKMPHITHIYLSGCQLRGSVPAVFGHLRNLDLLDLSDNRLEQLPPSALVNCRTLRVLDLSINKLTRLPATIDSLGALCELNVADNDLVELPATLGHLHLHTLDASQNLLRTLPGQLCTVPLRYSLRVLRVRGNVLVELPERLGMLSRITELDIRDNNLHCLPSGASALTDLRVLHYTGNRWPAEAVRCVAMGFKQQQLESSYGPHAVSTLNMLISGMDSPCTMSNAAITTSSTNCDVTPNQEPLLLKDLTIEPVIKFKA